MFLAIVRMFCVPAFLWEVALRGIAAIDGFGNRVLSNHVVSKDERIAGFEDWIREKPHSNGRAPEGPKPALATSRVFVVDKSGAPGCYVSVQAAVDHVPQGNTQRVIIQIGAGMFHEKVRVPFSKPFITFQGAGKVFTTIAWGDTVQKAGSVANSATLDVDAKGFIARNLTIQNTAPQVASAVAVALRISGDQAAFYDCNIIGAQDTVYDDQGQHQFENCFIQGSVKFICGNGQSLYKGCRLQSTARGAGSVNQARRLSSGQDAGFSFVGCSVTGSSVVYLGRVWGPHSRVVFAYTQPNQSLSLKSWFNWRIWNRYKIDERPFVYIT